MLTLLVCTLMMGYAQQSQDLRSYTILYSNSKDTINKVFFNDEGQIVKEYIAHSDRFAGSQRFFLTMPNVFFDEVPLYFKHEYPRDPLRSMVPCLITFDREHDSMVVSRRGMNDTVLHRKVYFNDDFCNGIECESNQNYQDFTMVDSTQFQNLDDIFELVDMNLEGREHDTLNITRTFRDGPRSSYRRTVNLPVMVHSMPNRLYIGFGMNSYELIRYDGVRPKAYQPFNGIYNDMVRTKLNHTFGGVNYYLQSIEIIEPITKERSQIFYEYHRNGRLAHLDVNRDYLVSLDSNGRIQNITGMDGERDASSGHSQNFEYNEQGQLRHIVYSSYIRSYYGSSNDKYDVYLTYNDRGYLTRYYKVQVSSSGEELVHDIYEVIYEFRE